MNQLSEWKLTLSPASSPVVLLDYGSELVSPVKMPLQRMVSVEPLTRSAAPYLHDGQNVSGTISFEVLVPAASNAAAGQAMLTAMLTALSRTNAPLKVERSGVTDRYWLFADALAAAVTPDIVTDGPPSNYSLDWEITVVGLSQVII